MGGRATGESVDSCPNGYLLGSYRIATAPEPNSSRLTSFKSTCFDSPANNVQELHSHRPEIRLQSAPLFVSATTTQPRPRTHNETPRSYLLTGGVQIPLFGGTGLPPFVPVDQEVRGHRPTVPNMRSMLVNLAAMIGRMVEQVLHLPPERVLPRLALPVGVPADSL